MALPPTSPPTRQRRISAGAAYSVVLALIFFLMYRATIKSDPPPSVFVSSRIGEKDEVVDRSSAQQEQQQCVTEDPEKIFPLLPKTAKSGVKSPAESSEALSSSQPACNAAKGRNLEKCISRCPDEDLYLALWLLVRDQSRFNNRPLTIVDVGSNKGYSIASLLEAFDLISPPPSRNPRAWNYDHAYAQAESEEGRATIAKERRATRPSTGFFSKSALSLELASYMYANKISMKFLHGQCRESNAPPLLSPDETVARHRWSAERRSKGFVPAVNVYAVDGVRAHTDICERFFKSQNTEYVCESEARGLPYTRFNFSCIHAAVSKEEGTVQFPLMEFGSGVGAIGKGDANQQLVTVPKRTLASFMPPEVEVIDVLLTDTEGHDFDVYEGGRDRFLREGKVGIYVFETHYGPNKRSLRNVIEELESYGYSCYFPMAPGYSYLYPITPVATHYKQEYDTVGRGWKNVACFQTESDKFHGLKEVAKELTMVKKEPVELLAWSSRYPWHAAAYPVDGQ